MPSLKTLFLCLIAIVGLWVLINAVLTEFAAHVDDVAQVTRNSPFLTDLPTPRPTPPPEAPADVASCKPFADFVVRHTSPFLRTDPCEPVSVAWIDGEYYLEPQPGGIRGEPLPIYYVSTILREYDNVARAYDKYKGKWFVLVGTVDAVGFDKVFLDTSPYFVDVEVTAAFQPNGDYRNSAYLKQLNSRQRFEAACRGPEAGLFTGLRAYPNKPLGYGIS